MENKNVMKAAENVCNIEGILSEVNITTGTGKTSNKDYIMGEVKVKTEALINGVPTELEIPVRVFANKYKNDGAPNPAYESIERIQSMTSLAACGGDLAQADRIKFDNANIKMNEFYNKYEIIEQDGKIFEIKEKKND